MSTPAQYLDALLARSASRATDHGACRLAWQEWPAPSDDAQPLLLLHGGFGSWTHWAANVDALSKRFAVWTVDLPGLGASGDLPAPQTLEQIAGLVLSGWNELVGENRRFDVAGFSFGGMVAGELAAAVGERCARCLLIGAVGFGELQHQVDLLPPPAADAAPGQAVAVHRENLARLMIHDPARIDRLALHIHSENLARYRFNSRRLAVTSALADRLREIPARLVGIWGEMDATAGGAANIAARRDMFSAAQPGSGFHVVPGVGHWAMYEAPERLNQLLLEG